MSESAEIAVAVVAAIHSGDVAGLRQLLAEHPGVASEPLGGKMGWLRQHGAKSVESEA